MHYGHKEGSLNAKMKPFLFGSRLGHTIFDLDITAFHLRQALNFIAHVAYNDGIILFISRNPQFTLHVENLAKELKEFSITRTWKHGLFTNAYISYGCIARLPDLCIFFNTLDDLGQQHVGVEFKTGITRCTPPYMLSFVNEDPNVGKIKSVLRGLGLYN